MSYTGFTPMMVQYCDYIQKSTNSNKKDGVLILEVGVDKGQTTYPLIQNLVQKDIKFSWFGVDIREDATFGQTINVMTGVDHFFVSNVNPDNSTVYYAINDSREFLKKDSNIYDLVLIDADHNYDTVKEELSHLNRITHPGSLVIMDDYGGKLSSRDTWFHTLDSHKDLEHASHDLDTSCNKGGVTRAVDEFVESQNGLWVKHVMKGFDDCCVLLRGLNINIQNADSIPIVWTTKDDLPVSRVPLGSNTDSYKPRYYPVTDASYVCDFFVS